MISILNGSRWKNELIKVCIDLVKIRSLSGQERELAYYIKEKIDEFGLKADIDDAGNVYTMVRGEGEKKIIFDGHMDTVPEGRIEKWRVPPYSGKLINGEIYGRGTVDMKGGISSMLTTLKYLSEKNLKPKSTIIFLFVVLEEIHEGFGLRKFLEGKGVNPDLVILGEPTDLSVATGQRGRVEVEVVFKGKIAHASMPEHGENACLEAVNFIKSCNEIYSFSWHPLMGSETLVVTGVRSKTYGEPVVPDACKVSLDVRFPLGVSKAKLIQKLRKISDSIGVKPFIGVRKLKIRSYTGIEEEVEQFFPSWIQEPGNLLNKVLKAIRKGEERVETKIWRFSTDGAYSKGIKNIPTVGFGPGKEELSHQPNEHVSVNQLFRAFKVYLSMATQI